MSDDRWLSILNGTSSRSELDEERLADALRKSILAEYEQSSDEAAFVPDEAALQRLLFRCRREGLLNDRKVNARMWRGPALAMAAMLFLVIGLAVIYTPQIGTVQPDVAIRGIEAKGVLADRVADPFKEMNRLRDRFKAYGVACTVYQSGGAWFVKAEIPHDAPVGLLEELKSLGFKPGAKDFQVKIEKEE